jgi:PAS domain S-box-containing protein
MMVTLTDYRLQQREYLLRIARAMTSRLSLREVLRLVIQHAVSLVDGEAGLIALRRSDNTFAVAASYGIDRDLLRHFAPLLTDIPPSAFDADPPWWALPWLQRRLTAIASFMELPLGDTVAVPLTFADELIGVILVFRGLKAAHFSPVDRQLLADFADIAAIAVRNAQLFQQVIEERQQLQTLVAHTEEGVAILDPEGTIQLFNRALSSMTGWPSNEAVGRPATEVLQLVDEAGEPVRTPATPLQAQPDNGRPRRVEGWLLRRDGHRGPYVSVTVSPLYDSSGRLFSVVVNFQDVTRFKEAEDLKSTFISVISHELKTPLALITGYAETLDRDDVRWDDETVRESLAIIKEESARLNRLIEDLLDAARIEAGALKLKMSYVRVDELARSVVETLRPLERDRLIALDFPTDLPAVFADPERIRQVLRNLVSNAIKYSPPDSLIRVGGRVQNGEVVLFVSDEGEGIPAEEQQRLFQRFTRGSAGRHTPGAGLGLYLSKAIVEAHGGRIWVESTPGEGSTFYFSLPIEGK